MPQQVRSVRAQKGVTVQRVTCAQCELSWNRPKQGGQVPRFCSDACRTASWRERVGSSELNRRRSQARARVTHEQLVRCYHEEFDMVSKETPLAPQRALVLLYELASCPPRRGTDLKDLYRKAAAVWHPDKAEGDVKVFKLLELAYRVAKSSGL